MTKLWRWGGGQSTASLAQWMKELAAKTGGPEPRKEVASVSCPLTSYRHYATTIINV